MARKANNRRTSGASEKKNIRMGKTDGRSKNYYTIWRGAQRIKRKHLKQLYLKTEKRKDTQMTVSFLHFNQNGTNLIPVMFLS